MDNAILARIRVQYLTLPFCVFCSSCHSTHSTVEPSQRIVFYDTFDTVEHSPCPSRLVGTNLIDGAESLIVTGNKSTESRYLNAPPLIIDNDVSHLRIARH